MEGARCCRRASGNFVALTHCHFHVLSSSHIKTKGILEPQELVMNSPYPTALSLCVTISPKEP